jgi:3-oxoacyl-[acyl-carrier-protein] synthase-3
MSFRHYFIVGVLKMATLIKAIAVSTDPEIHSSIAHGVVAGRECLRLAGVFPQEIDILFNVGVYRDSNLVEPAIAALIQKELQINLDYIKYPTKKAAVSFDIMNGACGLLNAVQVADAFLATHHAQYILVVSSDAHPSNQSHEGFPYATLGTAMLLERSASKDLGFGNVQHRLSPGAFVGLEGFSELYQSNSKNLVTVQEHPDYKEKLLEFLTDSIQEYLANEKIGLDDTLLITSQVRPDFGSLVARKLGLEEKHVMQLSEITSGVVSRITKDPHSSALALGYHQAIAQGIDQKYSKILFATAGAGLSSACVVYRR